MWTEADREAPRTCPLPPPHTSTEPRIASLAENKLERFVRCLGIVRTGPAPCRRRRGKVRLMVMDWGGEERELGLACGEKLFSSVPWGGGSARQGGREGAAPLLSPSRADRMWAAAQESTHTHSPGVTRGLNR